MRGVDVGLLNLVLDSPALAGSVEVDACVVQAVRCVLGQFFDDGGSGVWRGVLWLSRLRGRRLEDQDKLAGKTVKRMLGGL